EYPLAMALACLLVPPMTAPGRVWLSRFFPEGSSRLVGIATDVALAAFLGLVTYGLMYFFFASTEEGAPTWMIDARRWLADWISEAGDKIHVSDRSVKAILIYGLPVLACYSFATRPLRFGLAVGAFLLAGAYGNLLQDSKILRQERSFFGVLKVQ